MLFVLATKSKLKGCRVRKKFRPRGENLEVRWALAIAAEEQLFVYLLNRARHDPEAYQIETGLPVDLSGVAASPPVAVNNALFNSAEFKAEEMAANNYFAHQSQTTGIWPNQLARNQGYVLPSYFPNTSNQIESLAAGTFYDLPDDPLFGLIYDEGIDPPGHRFHMLSIGSFYQDNREIGVGHGFNNSATYRNYWAIHLTQTDPLDTFLTGVAFHDANGNDRYDLNEGLSGVTITAGGLSTTTNAAGGWSIKTPGNASYQVSASGGSFVGTSSSLVNVGSSNVEVDFISGEVAPFVNFVAPANQVPQAGNDMPSTTTNASVTVDVLANDSDPENALNPASLQLVALPLHGTATIDTLTHQIEYSPTLDYSGSDSFTYRVADAAGQFSNVATVSVTIQLVTFPWRNPVNRFDVNGLNGVSNIDLFISLTDLRTNLPRTLAAPTPGNEPPPYLDVSGDNKITNLDYIQVLVELRRIAAEGEGTGLPEGEGLGGAGNQTASQASSLMPSESYAAAVAALFGAWDDAAPPMRKLKR